MRRFIKFFILFICGIFSMLGVAFLASSNIDVSCKTFTSNPIIDSDVYYIEIQQFNYAMIDYNDGNKLGLCGVYYTDPNYTYYDSIEEGYCYLFLIAQFDQMLLEINQTVITTLCFSLVNDVLIPYNNFKNTFSGFQFLFLTNNGLYKYKVGVDFVNNIYIVDDFLGYSTFNNSYLLSVYSSCFFNFISLLNLNSNVYYNYGVDNTTDYFNNLISNQYVSKSTYDSALAAKDNTIIQLTNQLDDDLQISFEGLLKSIIDYPINFIKKVFNYEVTTTSNGVTTTTYQPITLFGINLGDLALGLVAICFTFAIINIFKKFWR